MATLELTGKVLTPTTGGRKDQSYMAVETGDKTMLVPYVHGQKDAALCVSTHLLVDYMVRGLLTVKSASFDEISNL